MTFMHCTSSKLDRTLCLPFDFKSFGSFGIKVLLQIKFVEKVIKSWGKSIVLFKLPTERIKTYHCCFKVPPFLEHRNNCI